MKNDKLLQAMSDIDDKLILKAAPHKKAKVKWVKWVSVAAALAIMAVGITALGYRPPETDTPSSTTTVPALTQAQSTQQTTESATQSTSRNWPKKEVAVETNAAAMLIPKWHQQTISQQFRSVEYNQAKYSSQITELDSKMVQNKLSNATLKGYDIYTETNYTANATVYSIKGISEKCAVALQFEGRTDYYVYINSDYKPATLEQLINDLNLKQHISFGTVWYSYHDENKNYVSVEFVDLPDNKVWEMLLNDTSLENVYDQAQMYMRKMSVSVNIPILGYKNIGLWVTEDGYLVTNILSTGKAFYIGEQKVKDFMDYVINNCEGYEIVHIYYTSNNSDNTIKTSAAPQQTITMTSKANRGTGS
ncbi:MAG: hypothetical protein IJF54_03910 [Clostridia bacterium]|nr:hypothetical protein [Clostridia bacterium]